MRDYSNSSPPNLFPPQRFSSSSSKYSPSGAVGPENRRILLTSRRRASDQMGEGYYNSAITSIDETNGNESPKKRARTGSLSDHGIF
jgi:hypothetical protein